MRYLEGRENEGRKTISGQRNKNILLLCLRGYKIQRDSIRKIGTKTNKRKMSGKHKFQKISKISQMVFRNRVLKIHQKEDRVLSSPHVQHQGGRCSS